MSKISDHAWGIVNGSIKPPTDGCTDKGYCEAFAWRVVRDALKIDPNARHGINHSSAQTAEDTSWRLKVKDLLPGDLIYQAWHSYGHVGIYLGEKNGVKYVLENTTANRGQIVGGYAAFRLTPLSHWGKIRSIVRFPEDTKTARDLTQKAPDAASVPVGAAVAAAAPGAATPASPETRAPDNTIYGQIKTAIEGLLNGTKPDAKVIDEDPNWFFHALPGYEDRVPSTGMTNLGGVRSLIVLRTPYDNELQNCMPVFGPFMISLEDMWNRGKKELANIQKMYEHTESWGKYYKPMLQFAGKQDPNTAYRFALPDVVSVSYRQESNGTASADIELEIPVDEDAEMILATLCSGSVYKNLFVEIWLPMFYHNENSPEGETEVLCPVFTGMIEEVTGNPYPNTIRFRVIPQDAVMNGKGIDPSDGTTNSWQPPTPLHQIVTDVARDYGITLWTPSALSISQLKQLQPTISDEYNALYMPPMDVIRQIVEESAGLKLSKQYGLDIIGRVMGIGRGGWMIYDPLAFSPLTAGFWKNLFWTNGIHPFVKTLTGHEVQGEVTVFYPYDLMSNRQYIDKMSTTLALYGDRSTRKTFWANLADTISSIGAALHIGTGPAVYSAMAQKQFKTGLSDFIKNWYKAESGEESNLQKWMVPTLKVEEFTQRTPSEQEMSNPIYGTMGGYGPQQKQVTVERAANLMQIGQAPDGSYYLQTPNGQQTMQGSDKVYMYYSANMSRPSMVVPVNDQAQREAASKFYPYTISLSVKPQYGVRVGGLATLVGFGRLDGNWEIQGVQHSLSASSQELIVTLRTTRGIFFI